MSISTALFVYLVMKMHQEDGLKNTNHILLQSCVYCLDVLSVKISAFFIQWQLDAFVHIRDFLERHKLVLLRVRFGLSARERPPASGMNETYITWECLRWRVAKLKYGGRIYVWLKWGWQWWWHTRAPAASNGHIPRIPSLVWAGRELASLCLF